MAFESREIVFSDEEVSAALLLFLSQVRNADLRGERVEHVDIVGDDALSAEYSLSGALPRGRVEGAELLSALISFCIQCRIPLPKSAPKNLRRIGGQLALVFNDWRIATPVAA